MPRVCVENVLQQCTSAHVRGHIAAIVRRAQQRQSVETRRVDVGRIFLVHSMQEVRITRVAVVFFALAIQNLDRAQIVFFPLGLGFSQPFFWSGREFLQRVASGAAILLLPDRMIGRHGFAPVSHGEIWIGFFRSAKRSGGIVVFEVVKLRQSAEKIFLNGGRAGIGERYIAYGGLRTQRRRSQEY
jgi:hypothetical protein